MSPNGDLSPVSGSSAKATEYDDDPRIGDLKEVMQFLVGVKVVLENDPQKPTWRYVSKNAARDAPTVEDFDPVFTRRSYNVVQNAVKRKVAGPKLTR